VALAALQPLFQEQLQYGELYKRNYYKEVKEKNRIHYELYSLDGTQEVSEDYKEISLVFVRKMSSYAIIWNVNGMIISEFKKKY